MIPDLYCREKQSIDSPNKKSDSPLPRPLLLTDCCSLFSSILRMRPNANERRSRIILAHLRDLQALLTISFVDASVNIGDAGTKRKGNTTLLYEFLRTGRFTISLVGRKEVIRPKKKWVRNSPRPRKFGGLIRAWGIILFEVNQK